MKFGAKYGKKIRYEIRDLFPASRIQDHFPASRIPLISGGRFPCVFHPLMMELHMFILRELPE